MSLCFQNLSQEVHEWLCKSHRHISHPLSNLTRLCAIGEYDLDGEGDLFKAPEPIIEEPVMGIDPMTGQCVILSNGLEVADMTSLENEPLFSDVYYQCGEDLMEKPGLFDETILENMILTSTIDEKEALKDEMPVDMAFVGTPFQKSVSLECLNSLDWMQGAPMKPSLLDFSVTEIGAAHGVRMRRAFSEEDMKILTNCSERLTIVGNCTTEERREKLSRYRNKKAKRNFVRKIKYACRKALADSQPRIRGRFARTEEIEACCKRP